MLLHMSIHFCWIAKFSDRDSWDTELHAGPLCAGDFLSAVSKTVITGVKDSADNSNDRVEKLKVFESLYNISRSFDPTKAYPIEASIIQYGTSLFFTEDQ